MWPLANSLSQPGWPNSHGSRWAFFMPHSRHLRNSPFSGHFVVRSACYTRAITVRQHVQRVHDLGMFQFFTAHFRVGGLVYPFLRDEGKEQ